MYKIFLPVYLGLLCSQGVWGCAVNTYRWKTAQSILMKSVITLQDSWFYYLLNLLTEWSFCVCLGLKTNSSFIHFWTVNELLLLCLRPDYFALPSQQSVVTVCVTAWGPLTQWLWVKCPPTWQWTQYPVTVALRLPPATRSVALWPRSTLAQCSTQMVRNLQS